MTLVTNTLTQTDSLSARIVMWKDPVEDSDRIIWCIRFDHVTKSDILFCTLFHFIDVMFSMTETQCFVVSSFQYTFQDLSMTYELMKYLTAKGTISLCSCRTAFSVCL